MNTQIDIQKTNLVRIYSNILYFSWLTVNEDIAVTKQLTHFLARGFASSIIRQLELL